ncbi:hypothetical protein J1N35_037599, partial [Gossypium stocksii]
SHLATTYTNILSLLDPDKIYDIITRIQSQTSLTLNYLPSCRIVFFHLLSDAQNYGDIHGIRVLEKLDHYLGLSLFIGKQKTGAFKHILDHFSNRINSWSKPLLSYGGKKVFNKSILQLLLIYAMSVLLAPRGMMEEMTSKIYRWWWASKEKGHGWAMFAWDKKYLPKGMDDIGFIDLRLFNLALINRQVYRLISRKDTLCF